MFFKVLQKNTFSHKKIKIYARVPKLKKLSLSQNIVANGGVPFTVPLNDFGLYFVLFHVIFD